MMIRAFWLYSLWAILNFNEWCLASNLKCEVNSNFKYLYFCRFASIRFFFWNLIKNFVEIIEIELVYSNYLLNLDYQFDNDEVTLWFRIWIIESIIIAKRKNRMFFWILKMPHTFDESETLDSRVNPKRSRIVTIHPRTNEF